ncbi:MAG TPA: hypothetical protein VNW51_04305 [Mucilaginibacter sp.]|jgi:hypothetical protein|nr:hypothetical protein [Mucilaginibacter sp.]
MADLQINSHADLKNEIYRLQGLEREKGRALRARFNGPGAILQLIFSIFSKNELTDEKDGGIFKQDFIGVLSRFVLPFALNRTLFRNSGLIIKTIVGLISQKASLYISEDSVESVWDKAKGLLGKAVHLFDKSNKKPEIRSFKKIRKD